MTINPLIFILLIVLITQTIHPALAQKTDIMNLKYNILSQGKKVGIAAVKLSRSGNTHTYAEYSRIKTSGWWGKIDAKSILIEKSINQTLFVSADAKTLDGKTVYWTNLIANGNDLRGAFAEIKNITVQEKLDIMDIAFAISDKQAQNSKEILASSRALLANKKSQLKKVQLSSAAFDTTANNLPFFLQKFVGKRLPKTLDIMDTEDLAITRMKIKYLGLVEFSIGGKTISARHFKLSGSKFKSAKIWIKTDPTSLPYIVRYVGENEDGPFELRLTDKTKSN